MIHHHGTPITPRAKLLEMAGRHFCVRYGEHRDVDVCHEIGQSVMLDNGAFSAWTMGVATDWDYFAKWARPWLDYHTTWAVAPDVIGGTAEENDLLLAWFFNHHRDVWERSAPVWHMHEPLERLERLCAGYQRVCVGSSGEYREPGSARWVRRLDEAFNLVCGNGPAPVWLHMLRAMNDACFGDWPFASSDSTNIGRNHNRGEGAPRKSPKLMAEAIDARQPPARWRIRHHTAEMVA